jgi:hypothetical protein
LTFRHALYATYEPSDMPILKSPENKKAWNWWSLDRKDFIRANVTPLQNNGKVTASMKKFECIAVSHRVGLDSLGMHESLSRPATSIKMNIEAQV